ncbi:MAG: radical SAM protein, partial [Deltaproteobacteria bacterium]|nr:radical SAM protein [Deltaproteobacteria bacterium]
MNDFRPYSVNIEITLACDLRCGHCGSSAGRPRPDELTFDELSACFADLADLGCEEVCLLGGEALLRRDWAELCEEVGRSGLGLVLITNGTHVDAGVVGRLATMPHLRRVGVSLDAADPEVHDAIRGRAGTHARAVGALFALRDAGIETGAITTVSRKNLDQLAPLRDLLVGQNLTWQIQMASPGGLRFDRGDHLAPEEFYEIGRFISECRVE